MKWFKIDSWHALKEAKDDPKMGLVAVSYCNRKAVYTDVVDDLPVNEKSCETCLAKLARIADTD
jgi:hypothetical protein